MKAKFVGGKYNGWVVDEWELEFLDAWTGRYTPNHSNERYKGICCPRAELDNRPIIDSYLSPMWDGGMLRYETQEAYDWLSR